MALFFYQFTPLYGHNQYFAINVGEDRMELVIVQQNVCGRDVYEGKRNIQDYEILIKEVREENPDIIFLTEFYYR